MMDGQRSNGYDAARMSTKRAGCEQCEPVALAEMAHILGLAETYARKLVTMRSPLIPAPQPKRLGQLHWWWKHDVESFAAARKESA